MRNPEPRVPDPEQGVEPSTAPDIQRGPRQEWGVYLFLALLVGFNLFVFFGSGGPGGSGGGGEQAVTEEVEGDDAPPPSVTVLPPVVLPEEKGAPTVLPPVVLPEEKGAPGEPPPGSLGETSEPPTEASPLVAPPSSGAIPLVAPPSSGAIPLVAPPSSGAIPLVAPSSSEAIPLVEPPSSEAIPLVEPPSSEAIPLVAPPSPGVHYEPPPSPPPMIQFEARPSPPPPPSGVGQGVGGGLGGPELLLGIAALSRSPQHGLSAAQKQAILPLLVRLEEPRVKLRALTMEALACLTEEQVQWMRARRGPVEVGPAGAQPGMDPVSSAALTLLRAKGGATKGEAVTRKHKEADLNFHDLLHGVLRLEKDGDRLALSPAQAKTLVGKVLEGSRIHGEETALYRKIGAGLSPAQREYLQANPELVRLDVNALTLRYARAALEP